MYLMIRGNTYRVKRQPENRPDLVYSEPDVVTEFIQGDRYKARILLGHNTLPIGKDIGELEVGDAVLMDREFYEVKSIVESTPIDVKDPRSSHIMYDHVLPVELAAVMAYSGSDLVLQTCLEFEGDSFAKRLYVRLDKDIEND